MGDSYIFACKKPFWTTYYISYLHHINFSFISHTGKNDFAFQGDSLRFMRCNTHTHTHTHIPHTGLTLLLQNRTQERKKTNNRLTAKLTALIAILHSHCSARLTARLTALINILQSHWSAKLTARLNAVLILIWHYKQNPRDSDHYCPL